MELRQLEHFAAIAEDRSFTKAARRLNYVQSALSVSIQALERELGVRLFDRTTHRVTLTGAGEALLPAALRTLAAAEEARDIAAAVRGVLRGRLRVGLMQSFTFADIPGLLGQFHRQHPVSRSRCGRPPGAPPHSWTSFATDPSTLPSSPSPTLLRT